MSRLSRFIMGTVTVSASGNLPALISGAMKEGIEILRSSSGTLTVRASDRRRLFRAAQRLGCTLKIEQSYGAAAELQKRRLAAPALVLAAVFIAVFALLNTRIISVEVPPVAGVRRTEVIEYLEKLGVYVGAKRSEVDAAAVKRELPLVFPQISYCVLNTYPGRAVLMVREKTDVPDAVEAKTGETLVALYDAVVTQISLNGGSETVKKGDAVAAGQLLASGTAGAGASGFVRGIVAARAKIYVGTSAHTLIETGENTSVRTLYAFGKAFPLDYFIKLPAAANINTVYTVPKLFNVELPFRLRTDTYLAAREVTAAIDEKNFEHFANIALNNYIERVYASAKLLRASVVNAGNWYADAEYTVECRISGVNAP